MMRSLRLLAFVLLAFCPMLARAQREKLPVEDLEVVEKRWPNAKRTSTSLRTVILKNGTGEPAQIGDVVDVLYTGQLLNGTTFDQAQDPAHPFSFRVGRGLVIEAWEEAFQMMKVGEKRIIIVPFELGYGTRGDPPKIPQRSTLIFEAELIAIHRGTTQ